MISALISFLLVALVLIVVYVILGKFLDGKVLQIVGLIFGLILLLYAVNIFLHPGVGAPLLR